MGRGGGGIPFWGVVGGGGGGTQFILCCQPHILILKLTPKQVFSSPRKETLYTQGDSNSLIHIIKPKNTLFKVFFCAESNPFYVSKLLDDVFSWPCPHCKGILNCLFCSNLKKKKKKKTYITSMSSL